MPKVVVIGSLNMDLVAMAPRLPLSGETLTGTTYLQTPGGKGANQAYAAARLGGQVAMLGCIGSDAHGAALRASLQAAGCDVSRVREVECASGVALIIVASAGDNAIVVVPGANGLFKAEHIQADEESLNGASHCLLQLEIPYATVAAAARAAQRRGACVILDPAPAPQTLPAELLANVGVLTPNEVEASTLAGRPSIHLDREQAQDVAKRLRAAGARAVMLKLGSQGCYYCDAVEEHWEIAPTVPVVDTTAAGDVFNAAFAVARSEGASIREGCRFAVTAAALSVTRAGAQSSMPSRQELEEY